MSFSADMKDFLNAYKVGQSINASRTDQDYKEQRTKSEAAKMARDNDPETLELARQQAQATLAATKDRMLTSASARANSAASRDYTAANTAIRRKQLELLNQPDPGSGLYPPGAINPAAGAAPAPGGLPIGPSTLSDDPDRYADGGLVPDDDGDDDAGVLDTEPEVAAPANAPTDVSAQRRPRQLEGIISPQLVEDARRAGLTFGLEKSGLAQGGALRTPAAQLKAKQIAQGMGGLSQQEMEAAKKAVDPEGKLTDSQRNLAALGSVYQFWANKGEPERAQRVAFQMLQYYRGASQRYAAIAAKAAEGGNMDLATQAALKAYANVPDGKDLELGPDPENPGRLIYAYTDKDGNTISKGVATPQQLAASAMGLATGGFDKALLQAAGATPATAAPKGGGGKGQSASDRAKESETIGGEIEKMKTAWTAKNKDKPVDEEQWNEIGNAAQHIYQQNPKATPNEVARAAHAMLSMGDDPEKPGFKVKPGEDGAPSVVDFGGKLKVKLDDEALEGILNARAAKVKAATDAIDKKMTDSEKPGFVDKATEAAGNIGGILADDAKKFAGEVRGAIPDELAARGGSAMNAVGRAVNDVVTKLTDPSINTGTISTAYKKGVMDAAQAVSGALSNKGAIPVDDGDRPL